MTSVNKPFSLLSQPELHVELQVVGVVTDPVDGGPPPRVHLAPATVAVRLLEGARALPLLLVPPPQILQANDSFINFVIFNLVTRSISYMGQAIWDTKWD